MSALGSKADICSAKRYVRFIPKSGHCAVRSNCLLGPMAERANQAYAVAAIGRRAAMGQLLAVLIVPPIVGLVTYFVVRLLLERDENGANEGHSRNGLEGPKVADPPPT